MAKEKMQEASEELKARLTPEVVKLAQMTLAYLPKLSIFEEAMYWQTIACAYQCGRSDYAEESLRNFVTKTAQQAAR
jgi:hypothetical protein